MLKAQDEGLSFLTGHIYRRELHAVSGTVHEIVMTNREKKSFKTEKRGYTVASLFSSTRAYPLSETHTFTSQSSRTNTSS